MFRSRHDDLLESRKYMRKCVISTLVKERIRSIVVRIFVCSSSIETVRLNELKMEVYGKCFIFIHTCIHRFIYVNHNV